MRRRAWVDDVASCLQRFDRRKCGGKLFWSLTLLTVERMVDSQLSELGLQLLSFSPHCLRPGGACIDAYHGLILAEVKSRGRQLADRSGLRFEKHGKLLRNLRTVRLSTV